MFESCARRVLLAGMISALLAACGNGKDGADSRSPSVASSRQAITHTVPGSQTVVEDTPLYFSSVNTNAIGVTDESLNLTVVVQVTNGVFYPGSTTGVSVSGSGTTTVTLTGLWRLTDGGTTGTINAALEDSRFVPAPNYVGPAVLTLTTTDPGNDTLTSTVNINVTAVNDAPVNGAPAGALSATEDVPYSLVMPITDVDLGGGTVTVSLSASNSTLMTLATTANVTFATGDGTLDSAMTFSGSLPDVNAALNGLTVTPPLNYIGQSTITVTTNDNGSTGSGGAREDIDTITYNWGAVNDPPVNTVAGAQSTTEDQALTFSGATAFGVNDVDATNGFVQVTLDSTNGTLTLGSPSGVSFSAGDGTADSTMTFTGTLVAVNAALATVTFTPAANFAGTAVVSMRSNDLGNTGTGSAGIDVDTVNVTVSGVNDAPFINGPGSQATNEDVAHVFSAANVNLLSVGDVDASNLKLTLTVSNGTLTTGPRTNLSFLVGDGVADATMTFSGSVSNLNKALDGLTYNPTPNFFGTATLNVTVDDEGATGSGPVGTATSAISITLNSINDVPDAVNDSFTVAEDSGATPLAARANDLDVEGDTLTITAKTNGSNGTVVITGGGTGLTYQPNADFFGVDSFTYTISDGNGGTDVATVTANVTAVNDPPVANNDTATVQQDSTGNLINVLSNDSYAPDVGETLSLSAVSNAVNGSVSIGTGGRASFTPTAGFTGTASFDYTVSDGNLTAVGQVTVTVTAVNGTPVNSLPLPQQLLEDTQLTFSSIDGTAISVSDENSATLTVQVQVTNGTFSLSGTTGLTSVSGNGTGAVTLQGTIAALNTALGGSRYVPSANFNGTATLTITSSDSTGNSATDNLSLAVTAVNDAPINTVPSGQQSVTEDTPRSFTNVLVSDADVGAGLLQVTLTADNGTVLSLSQTSGLSITTGDGFDDATMTFTGTVIAINSALNGLTVTPLLDYIGTSSITLVTNDQGYTGSGGAGQDTDTITLNWAAVNDPPVNSVPGPQPLAEESSLTFSAGNGNAISVSDADAAAATLKITFETAQGTLSLGGTAGLVFTTGDGANDPSMVFTGTLSAINTAFNGTVFTPTANFAGTASITITTNDQGNSGGGARQDADTITVNVGGLNDPPVNTVPGAQSTNEDLARVFSVANGNAISVADVDAATLQVSLSVTNGTLTTGTRAGLTFQAGDGTSDGTMTFSGAVSSVNAALSGLSFQPNPNFFGTAVLTIFTQDLGSSGVGGSLFDLDSVTLTVAPVNDPPDAVNDSVAVSEDAPATTVAVLGNDLIAPDVGETLSVSAVVQPSNGTVVILPGGTEVSYQPNANFFGTDSFTYTVSDGNTTDVATVTVTVAAVNDDPTAINDAITVQQDSTATTVSVLSNDSSAPDVGETLTVSSVGTGANGGTTTIAAGATAVTYQPPAGFTGTDAFTYTVSDGNGGMATATVSVTVVAVNVFPVNTLPPPQQTPEDTQLVFSAVAGNAITVTDQNSATLTVQVQVTNGTFSLGTVTGLTSNTGNNTATVTIQGTLAALVTALNGARYVPAANYNGSATLTVTSSDSGGNSDTDVLTLTVSAVNDAPVNTVPSAVQNVTEDLPATFTTILVSDVDVGAAALEVKLTADNGTLLSLSRTTGLGFTAGTGTGDATMTFSGTVIAVNSALNGLTVTPSPNYIGTTTVVMVTSDLGSTGAGGIAQDTDTISFNWGAVNDAPVNTVPGPQTLIEEASLVFSTSSGNALSVADVDASAGTLQISLGTTQGTLSLGGVAGLTFSSGDGVGDAAMAFSGTLAALNTALRDTVFTPPANFAGVATITLTTGDLGNSGGGGAKTDTDTITVTVAGVNDPPTVAAPASQFTAEDTARIFDSATGNLISVADTDAATLRLTLSATNGALTTGTRTGLSFDVGDGIADSTMTFTGTVAALNAALNGLSYAPTPNYFGAATLTIDVSDQGSSGAGPIGLATAAISINVTSVNDAPDAVNDSFTVPEDSGATPLAARANDLDVENDTLTITGTTNGANGTVVITGGGTGLTYQPNANFFGTDSFTYTLSDGNGGTDVATVTANVTAVNDPPVAFDDTATVQQDSTGNLISVLSNDTFAPDVGETLSLLAVGNAVNGTVSVGAGGRASFTPTAGFIGTASFDYTLSDGSLTDVGQVTVTVVAVNGTPVNSLPAPQQTLEDTQLTFSSTDGTAMTVADENSATLTVQVQVTNGTFSLGGTTGLTSVTGNNSGTVTLQGTLAALNAALNGARYMPVANFNGSATLTITSSDSTGNNDSDVLNLTVVAVNDSPINTVPAGAQAVTEDTPRSFTNVLVSDVDVGGGFLEVTITADNGTVLSLAQTTGLAFTVGNGIDDATMTFTGTVISINSALNGLTVTPLTDYIGSSTLVMVTSDLGNTGSGGIAQDTDTITLNWAAVNDPPINSVPGPQNLLEETPLTFSSTNGNSITVADADAAAATLKVTLDTAQGTLSLGGTAGLVFTTGDGTNDSSMVFTGSLSSINTALNGTVFSPSANFAGTASITITTNDQGNSGGAARQDTDTITVNVGGLNDPPVNTVPTAQSTNEDLARVFSATGGNAISVADVDAATVQVSLSVTNGTLTTGTRTGLTFQAGDGISDDTMTFSGALSTVNAALNGLSFQPTPNFFGSAVLTIFTQDLGSSGLGGSLFDLDTVTITVAPVNDPPDAVNDSVAVLEDAPATVVAVLGNDLIAPDVAETLSISAVVQPSNGTVTIVSGSMEVSYQPNANFFGTDSFTYTVSDGNSGTDVATVTVTVSAVNDDPTATNDSITVQQDSTATTVSVLSNDSSAPDVGETLTVSSVGPGLNGGLTTIAGGATAVTYQPPAGFTGTDAFTYTVSDGNGGLATATVSVTVVAVNVFPVNTLPPPQQTPEDTQLVLSAVAGNAITVTDQNSATLTVQVQVTNGTFSLGSITGLTSNTGNNTATVTIQGTLATLVTALNGARFIPAANYNGPATLTVTSSDSTGNSDTDVLNLTVTAVNDAPANTVPAAVQTVTEDLPATFTTILVSDVDVGVAPLQVTLTADNGTRLSVSRTTGLAFTMGTGTGDVTMTFSGAVIDINSALNGLTVTPPANYIGTSTLVIVTSDLGSTGAGGIAQDTDTISFNWQSVNDPPVNSVPGPQAIAEEATLTFNTAGGNALSVSDVDASAGTLQISLGASHGTLTLGGVTGLTFSSGNGVNNATMVFSGTLTALNNALRDTVLALPVNFAGAATLTMTTSDLGNAGGGGAKTDTDTITVTVAGSNDPPVISAPATQTTSEDVARVFSAANANLISVADVDAATLQVSLTVTNGTLTTSTRTGLSFEVGDGIADSVMTFNGPVSTINTALNGLSFAPAANYFGAATLVIDVSDQGSSGVGPVGLASYAVNLNVTAVNDPPDAVGDPLSISEDDPATVVNVLGNDTMAPDVGETLLVSAVSTPVNGTAQIVSGGSAVSYTPNANFFGTDSFTYTLSDGNGGTDVATVTVTVASINDPPTAVNDAITVQQDSSATTVSVLSNDSFAPDVNETLTITAVSDPPSGSAAIVSGGKAVTYVPDATYTGADSFTYTISDGQGGVATATVSVSVLTVNGNPVNTLPVPQQLLEDTTLTFSTGNTNPISVTDANSASLQVQIFVTNGTFSLGGTTGVAFSGNNSAMVTIDGSLAALNTALNGARFIPTPNYAGAATLTVTSNDTNGNTDTDVLNLTVIAVNDAPVNTVPAAQTVNEDTPKVFSNILVSDLDVGANPLLVTLTANNGTFLSLPTTTGLSFLSGTGTADETMSFSGGQTDINAALNGLTVTPPLNYIGPSTLVIVTSDQGATGNGGAAQDTDTINFTWTAVNDAPVNAVPGAQTIAEEGTVTFSSALGTALTMSDVDLAAGLVKITLTAANGRVTLGNTSLVSLSAGTGTNDTAMTFEGNLANVLAALEGTTFTAAANFVGTATLTFKSDDKGNSGGAAATDTDVINITVTPVNDAPVNTVPATQNMQEDTFITFAPATGNPITVGDADSPPTLQVTLSALNGTVLLGTKANLIFQAGDGTAAPTMTFSGTITAINSALATLRFTPPTNFAGLSGVVILTRDLGATGAGGPLFDEDTVVVNVVNVNDTPTAANDSFTISEDTIGDFDVVANDSSSPDVGETLTISSVGTSTRGTVVITSNRITYTPNANVSGSDSFTYTISDGNGGTATATVSVTVLPVNDPPDAIDDAVTMLESSAATPIAVLANDSFAPDVGETLTVTATSTAGNGTVVITGAGVTYQPNPGFIGTDSFTYTISDGNGGSDTATVTVTVTDFDYTPVPVADVLTVVEDTPGTVAVLANDTALGDVPLTVTIQTPPTKGTASVQAGNTVLYTPNADENGTDTFQYKVTDADGDFGVGTVTVTITPADDAPVALAESVTTAEDTAVPVWVLTNDTVVDRPFSLTVATAPAHGTAVVEVNNTITYTPADNYNGPDSFVYQLQDSDGDIVTATVSVTVTPVNDPPVAVSDTAATRLGQPVEIDVLANDLDVDSDKSTLTIVAVGTPAHGTATIQAGKVRYMPSTTPDPYRGTDEFTYRISDGNAESTDAVVQVGVGSDSDGDGLEDIDETEIHNTNPDVADTDGDLIADGLEINVTRTDALDDDSDDDGLLDGNEDLNFDGVLDANETNPLEADTDQDGLTDGLEKGLTAPQGDDTDAAIFVADAHPTSKTDPRKADTDNGGSLDGEEDINANGKVDMGETNPLNPRDDRANAPDEDGDGVPDDTDNCPAVANVDQADADANGVGDLCEPKSGCGCGAGGLSGAAPMGLLLWAMVRGLRRRNRGAFKP